MRETNAEWIEKRMLEIQESITVAYEWAMLICIISLFDLFLLLHRFVISLFHRTNCQRILFLFVADYETVDETKEKRVLVLVMRHKRRRILGQKKKKKAKEKRTIPQQSTHTESEREDNCFRWWRWQCMQ